MVPCQSVREVPKLEEKNRILKQDISWSHYLKCVCECTYVCVYETENSFSLPQVVTVAGISGMGLRVSGNLSNWGTNQVSLAWTVSFQRPLHQQSTQIQSSCIHRKLMITPPGGSQARRPTGVDLTKVTPNLAGPLPHPVSPVPPVPAEIL